MKDLITEYLLVKRASGRAAHTVYEYGYYLNAFAAHCGKPLVTIANIDVARWIVAEREARKLAPASVYARFRALRIFFNWCVENEFLDKSPIRMKAPRVPRRAPRVADLANVRKLLDQPVTTWQDHRDRALIGLLLDTGMRIGEVCSLAISHVDCARRLVCIPAGKDYEDRHAPFTERCADYVASYLENRPPCVTGCLFLRIKNRGRFLPAHAVWMLTKRSKAAGIEPYVNAHSIRHLFATKALNDGMRAEVVSRILGHASVDFTLQFYAVLMLDTIRHEYDRHWQI